MARVVFDTQSKKFKTIKWKIGSYKVKGKYKGIYIEVNEKGRIGLSGEDIWMLLERGDIIELTNCIDTLKDNYYSINKEDAEKTLKEKYYLDKVNLKALDWKLGQLLSEITSIEEFRDWGIVANISTEKFAVEYVNEVFNMNIEELYNKLLELNKKLFERLKEELEKRNIKYKVEYEADVINVPKLKSEEE